MVEQVVQDIGQYVAANPDIVPYAVLYGGMGAAGVKYVNEYRKYVQASEEEREELEAAVDVFIEQVGDEIRAINEFMEGKPVLQNDYAQIGVTLPYLLTRGASGLLTEAAYDKAKARTNVPSEDEIPGFPDDQTVLDEYAGEDPYDWDELLEQAEELREKRERERERRKEAQKELVRGIWDRLTP